MTKWKQTNKDIYQISHVQTKHDNSLNIFSVYSKYEIDILSQKQRNHISQIYKLRKYILQITDLTVITFCKIHFTADAGNNEIQEI